MRATCARWAQSCARSTSTRRKRLAPHLDACKHAHVCHHSPRCRRHRVCTSTLLTPSRCRSLPCCPCRPFPLVTPAPFQQLQRWIHEMEEEEPTGFIVYEKVCSAAARGAAQACRLGWTLAAASPQSCLIAAPRSHAPASLRRWWSDCSRKKHLNTSATRRMKSSQPSRRSTPKKRATLSRYHEPPASGLLEPGFAAWCAKTQHVLPLSALRLGPVCARTLCRDTVSHPATCCRMSYSV